VRSREIGVSRRASPRELLLSPKEPILRSLSLLSNGSAQFVRHYFFSRRSNVRILRKRKEIQLAHNRKVFFGPHFASRGKLVRPCFMLRVCCVYACEHVAWDGFSGLAARASASRTHVQRTWNWYSRLKRWFRGTCKWDMLEKCLRRKMPPKNTFLFPRIEAGGRIHGQCRSIFCVDCQNKPRAAC